MVQYQIWLFLAAIAGGVVCLVYGADRFVSGAAVLAFHLKISPLVIGLTIVAMGTSFPELLVTVTASLTGHPDMAVGNVLGSNITNIGLILGLTALVCPVKIHSGFVRREFPFLVLITFATWAMCVNGSLSRIEGVMLCAGLGLFVLGTYYIARREAQRYHLSVNEKRVRAPNVSIRASIFILTLGLVLLLLGSRSLVWGGVGLAHYFGVDELVIGLTLVALGTSLPELATTLAGVIKKEDDIAVGNVIGSNIFNTLGILGIPAIIHPLEVATSAVWRDFPVMTAMTLALLPICKSWPGRSAWVNRWEGAFLVFGYVAYISFLFLK